MKQALAQCYQMGFWTLNGSGMPEANVNKMIQVQITVAT